ncbi:MAG: TRAP transporter substrate-binding protein [Burkholderiales bacterium]|jgi:TRAP-type mannitol/chloroaromatic compound transport system substrate-binding protein|nr:TRAP transporter substrate-binding protein [Nitrosomonadaceae bacterium]
MTQETKSPATRRKFLAGSAAAGGAAITGFPMIAKAQTVNLRFQSTWPAKDIFHEYANDFAKRVNDMSSGKLKIEVLPSGSVVRAFDLIDAVSKGTLDGGHGVVAYWFGKQKAVALWGSGPAFGMDPNMVLAWHYYGGGRALLEELYKGLNLDVQSFVYGPMPTQPLGWFKKPVTKVEDLKGLKYRTVGLAVDLFTEMGAAVNPLPGAEIVPAIDRGLLDAAEFNNASSDRTLGFPDVSKNCMLQSFHQASENFEILFNKTKYNALPSELKAIIDNAVTASSADMSWKAIDRYSKDYAEMRAAKINFYKTPDSILRAQLAAWDKIVAKQTAENPAFKKVYDSMREFAARTCRWQNDTLVDYKMAYNHFFSTPARPAAAPAKKS